MSDLSDRRVEDYWRQLQASAEGWPGRPTAVQHTISIAGYRVDLRFADPTLAMVVIPALRHLAGSSESTVDLTVFLGDGVTTGTQPPPLPWPTIPGQAWTLQTERFLALHLPVLNSVLWFDRRERVAVYWLPDAAQCPLVERGSPLLTLWAWWLADRGSQLTHAAAIAGHSGAALLVGPGGSGKSTTALTCVGSPLRYLADDYCIVEPATTPVVHSLYCSGKVSVEDAPRFTALQAHAVGHDDEKTLFLFYPAGSELMTVRQPLRAIFVPVITGRPETTYAPISAMAAIRAAAPSTVLQLRVGTSPADALKRLSAIATRVPCYRLELGTSLRHIPGVLAQLLD